VKKNGNGPKKSVTAPGEGCDPRGNGKKTSGPEKNAFAKKRTGKLKKIVERREKKC